MNQNATNVILPTAVVNVNMIDRKVKNFARLIFDSCSQPNLVTESLVKRLKIPLCDSNVVIGWIAKKAYTSKHSCSLEISSRFSNNTIWFNADVVPFIPYNVPVDDIRQLHRETNLDEPGECDFLNGKVEILIGAEFYEKVMLDERRFYNDVAIRRTIFGNLMFGRLPDNFRLSIPSPNQCLLTINDQLKKFWELEEIETHNVIEDEELLCLKHFESTYTRDEEGRFVLRLPFKGNVKKLSKLYPRAVNALLRLEKNCDPDLKVAVNDFMKKYENLGHMKVKDDRIDKDAYFIPYQIVVRPTSTSTKVRVVFNASAKSKDQLSLNDILMKGPQLQPDIMTVMTKFRKHKVAFSADIRMMYRQIRIDDNDCKFQRILWRYSPNERIRVYELKTLTYGTTPASFAATKCLEVLAREAEKEFPEASNAIANNFYMDDFLTGASDVSSAINLQRQIHDILAKGCFPLCKYVSNSNELLEQLNPDLVLKTKTVDFNADTEVSVLGIIWLPNSDQFQIRLNLPEVKTSITKRSMLSELSKVFDPLGFLAPATICGKLLLQQLWKYQLCWDNEVPEELKFSYLKYRDQLSDITDFYIRRRYCSHSMCSNSVQLCGFSDASERAYSAVIYARCVHKNKVQSYFVCSKTRVAPLRELTIPKIELCGALLLAELMNKISLILNVPKTNIICFTDSTIVLCWLE